MIKTYLAPAALALVGFVGLAGCSSADHHTMAQNGSMAQATTAPSPVAVTPEISPGLIKRVQTSLKQQGFYKGRIDGVWGPETQSGIHGYQQAHNLSDSGELDSPTLASLRGTPVSSTQAAPATTAKAAVPSTTTTN
jgi:peptidoglycan hydrolase-like protein with peptidoglycan-binding domain